jgi:uncharacterized protein (UPF0261 family)
MRALYIIATMDTKGREARFMADTAAGLGIATRLVDVGTRTEPGPDIYLSNSRIASYAGARLLELGQSAKRMDALPVMAEGLKKALLDECDRGELGGVIAIGGSGGMSIASPALCALPFGIPKVMVTTIASGNMRPYIKGRDIAVFNSVADIIGLNVITETMLAQSVRAVCGMMGGTSAKQGRRNAVAITSFGSTDPCVQECIRLLDAAGYDSVAFHARGVSGGTVMEELVREGYFAAVLDVTTTEIADYVTGGDYACDETRLSAASDMGLPFVVAPGSLDMVNFNRPLPEHYKDRLAVRHALNTVLMRTDMDEMLQIADFMAKKLNRPGAQYRLLLPRGGVSAYDAPGKAFFAPEITDAFITAMEQKTDKSKIIVLDCHLNDAAFAARAVNELLKLIKGEIE